MTSDRIRHHRERVWATFEAEALPHVERLFRLAMWFERDRDEAEDLVQETLKEALASFHRFKAGTNCRAWLVSILQHIRGNRQRAKSRAPFINDPLERAAHVVALAAGAGLFLRPDDLDAIALDAVGDHRNCAVRFRLPEKPIPPEEAETRYAAWYRRLRDTPPAELALSAGPVRLVERHACAFNGRRFAHVVLQFQGQIVSLLVTEDRHWLPNLTGGEGQPHLVSQPVADGFSVMSFSTSRHRVLFVSNLGEPELREVAETVASPVARRLAGA